MGRIAVVVALVALAINAGALADPADPARPTLVKLAAAAKCDDAASTWRGLCPATRWSAGTAAALPAGKVLFGLTIELRDGADVADALAHKVSLTALVVGKDGKLKMTAITPSNDDEQRSIALAVGSVAAVLKHTAKTAEIPKDLAGYVQTIAAVYQPSKRGSEWTWEGASSSRARKVGDVWVVLETPRKDAPGIWVTVLTDAWQ